MRKCMWKRAAAGMAAAMMAVGILSGCSVVGAAPTIATNPTPKNINCRFT